MEERRILTGTPISTGVAKAEAYHYEPLLLNVEKGYFKPGKEIEYWRAFQEAKEKTEKELEQLLERVVAEDEKIAGIFNAHLTILRDEDLLYEIRSAILNDRMYPEEAVEACTEEAIASMKDIKDVMTERYVADIRDVKQRLLCNYFGKTDRDNPAYLSKDVILITQDILPSDIVIMDKAHVKGIITEKNVANSHAIVVARNYGIPMIVGVTDATKIIPLGATIELDGETGVIRYCE